MNILADLQATVETMQARTGVEVVEFRVGRNYAGFVCDELRERGVEVDDPEVGDEVSLSFTDGRKVRLHVH